MANRNYPIWRVYSGSFNTYYAEKISPDGKMIEYRDGISAHCLACAKTELMAEAGEVVDVRGWHKANGLCGGMAKSMQTGILQDMKDDNA